MLILECCYEGGHYNLTEYSVQTQCVQARSLDNYISPDWHLRYKNLFFMTFYSQLFSMIYTYLVLKVKYIYFPRRNVVIFPQSQRLRGNITTFLREKYMYLHEEQDMYINKEKV